MEEGFELPVDYKGAEQSFPAKLVRRGYIYQIEVEVADTLVAFEKDEEGAWRAMLTEADLFSNKKLDRELLESIIASLEAISS
jgi:hypothetical protein